MKLVIFASDLAGCIGRNQYANVNDLKLRYLKSLCADSYKLARNASFAGHELMEEKITNSLQLLGQCSSNVCNDINNMEQRVVDTLQASRDAKTLSYSKMLHENIGSTVAKIMETSNVPDTDKTILSEYCKSIAYKTLGTHEESCVSSMVDFDYIKDDTFHKRHVCDVFTMDGRIVRVYIGGKCDGIHTDASGNKVIVEIKNRTKRFFNRVVDYEYVQLMAYLFVFKIDRGVLIERFHGETKRNTIEFEGDKWEKISDVVRSFAQNISNMIISESD